MFRFDRLSVAFRVVLLCLTWQCIALNGQWSTCYAQFNTDRLVMVGRSALYYEDYVLSIQYFNQAINARLLWSRK